MAWAPDDSLIATTGFGGEIKIWDWNGSNTQVQRTLEASEGHVEWAVFSPDGAYLWSYCREDKVKKWDTSNWEAVEKLEATAPSGSRILDISPDGTQLALIAYQNGATTPAVEIWNVDPFDQVAVLIEDTLVRHRNLKWSPNGNYILVGGDVEEPGQRGGVVVWDILLEEKIAEATGNSDIIGGGDLALFGRVYGVDWSADSRYIGAGARPGADIQDATGNTLVWHLDSMKLVHKEAIAGTTIGYAWSPTGEHFAGSTTQRWVQIWRWPDI